LARSRRFAAIVLSLAALVVRAQESDPEAPPPPSLPSVPDAVQFYRLTQVTVVYPAGPGEDVERNRASARMRARYLELVGGMKAHEVADDQVGEAEKAGNLLVLGWNNRLFSGLPAENRAFVRTDRDSPSSDSTTRDATTT